MSSLFDRKFESALFDTNYRVQYAGETRAGYDDNAPQWKIWKLTWADNADGTSGIVEVKLRTGVAWADRATLDW